MNAALKIINTADKLAQHRPDRLPSEKQSEVIANLSLISRTWRTLTDLQRAGWTAFGQVWSPDPKKKSTVSGFIAFQSLNGVRLNSGQGDILPDAPTQPDFIAKLPAFTVTAHRLQNPDNKKLTLTGSAPAAVTALGLAIYVTSPGFDGAVVALATRPLSAGTSKPSPRLFRQIATFQSLPVTTLDLTDYYLGQFIAPAVGMKVAVQLIPVTPTGFRGNPFTQVSTVISVP